MDYKHFLYEEAPILLRGLNTDTPALWGMMNAQQMIEHLAFVVGISNGRFPKEGNAEPERLAYRKMRFFEQDKPFAKSIKVAFISEEPVPVQFADIEASKRFLFSQLERFDDYFTEHPDLMPQHVVFGPMNFDEWIQFHARHFRHHFQQFGLVPIPETE
jgi:hypothetical protein